MEHSAWITETLFLVYEINKNLPDVIVHTTIAKNAALWITETLFLVYEIKKTY